MYSGNHLFRDGFLSSYYDVEPRLRAIVKALFLAGSHLPSLQVGAGIARQGLITQVL